MGIVVMTIAGAASGLAVWSLLSTVFSEERAVARRLEALTEFEIAQAQGVEPLSRPFVRRVAIPVAVRVRRVLGAVIPAHVVASTKKKIRLAGLQRRLDVTGMGVASALFAAALFVVGLFLADFFGAKGGVRYLVLLVSVTIGVALPFMWLGDRVSVRQAKIRRSMPDALDMLMISVEAGLGFDAAVVKLVRSTNGPLAEEFGVMLGEMQAGISRSDAFHHLVERTQVPELETFALAMVQADLLGVSISQVLRTQAREMRVKRRQFAEEMAQKAPAKMVFPLILCILPATLIVLVAPAVIAIAKAFGAM